MSFLFLLVSSYSYSQSVEYVTNTSVIRAMFIDIDDTLFDFTSNPKNGNWIVYYDSTKKQVAFTKQFFENGEYDYKSWYRNGTPHKYETCSQNIPGLYNVDWWFPNGQLFITNHKTKDSCFVRHWYPNGVLFNSADGWGNDDWQYEFWNKAFYNEEGQLTQQVYDSPDSTIHKFYQANGNIAAITVYRFGSTGKTNKYLQYEENYFENGRLKNRGSYVLPQGAKNGQKHGTWSYYSESGKLIKEEFYEEGKLVRTTEY